MLRTVQLTSGLSFIMPTFFFLTVWLWWAEQLSSGLALLDKRHPRLPVRRPRSLNRPKEKKQDPFQSLNEKSFPELLADIQPRRCSWRWLLITAIVLVSFAFLMGVRHPITSLEKPVPLEVAMTLLFLLAICGIIVTTLRAWKVWTGLRKLLLDLDMTPLRDTFRGIEGFSWKPIWRFGAGSLPEFLRIFSRVRDAMDDAVKVCPQLLESAPHPEITDAFRKKIEEARSKPYPFSYDWAERRQAEREVLQRFGRYQKDSAELAGSALDFIADHSDDLPEQKKHSALRELIPYLAKEKNSAKRLRQRDEKLRAQINACQNFACMSYVNVLLVMLVRIRTLIVAAGGFARFRHLIGGTYVLTLVGISQYPFEPKGALQLLLVGLLAFVFSVVGRVFAQIHRDTILSNLTDTNPGELGIDFYIRMATFVALPLLSLLASQFPSVNRFFYSWLQPALESLNR